MTDDLTDYAGSTEQARDVLFNWLAGDPDGHTLTLSNGWRLHVDDYYGGPGIEITTPDGRAFVAIVEEADLCEDDADD